MVGNTKHLFTSFPHIDEARCDVYTVCNAKYEKLISNCFLKTSCIISRKWLIISIFLVYFCLWLYISHDYVLAPLKVLFFNNFCVIKINYDHTLKSCK